MATIKPSILVVDDQENWLILLKEILISKFDVTAVSSYEQALKKIASKTPPYHVVITDMRLIDTEKGNEHGLKLIEKLNHSDTKSVIITGYPTITTMQKAAFGLQVAYYFEKVPSDGEPFNVNEFLNIVHQAARDAEVNRANLVFILMPFAKEYETFYENEIKKTVEAIGLNCKRVDDFYGSRRIMSDIRDCIEDATLILADLTGRNPNVFFELGIAHALGKNVLLLTQKLNDVPNKLRTIRCIEYEKSWSGAAQFSSRLEKAILEIRKRETRPIFNQKKINPRLRQCFAIMPANETGDQTYRSLILRTASDCTCNINKSEEIFNSISILDELWLYLNEAELVIADLSGRDTDVFYLAGLAYGLGKKMIYLAQNETDVPFDLQEGSCLIYSIETYDSGLQAKTKLTQLIKDLLA